jgi:hypothetical protein
MSNLPKKFPANKVNRRDDERLYPVTPDYNNSISF